MASSQDSIIIWQDFIEGDQQALLKIYEEHYIGLMNYGAKLTFNRDFTNDCIMEMLIELWDKRANLSSVNNVRAYLITCLKRVIFNKIKLEKWKESKLQLIIDDAEPSELSYEDCLSKFQTDERIRLIIVKSLEKLTVRQKELLMLKFFDDFSYDEIALKCNISKRTAYNIIYDSIKILREDLSTHKKYLSIFEIMMILTVLSISLRK